MHRHIQILILLLVLAFTVGCVSPQRLFNLTPLNGSDSRNTVNLWPLCYGNKDGFSVLWPIFDANENGFALRPLVFKEGKEWGVLWPVSDFDENYFRLLNLVISQGYGFGVVPLFWIDGGDFSDGFYQFLLGYKLGKNWGLFPLLHNNEDFSYFFPLYYYNHDSKKLLTPVSYFSPRFNYFTLAWWNRENGHFGFYPLLHIGREGYRFLLWWKSPNSTGLFPIYISAKDFTAAGPVWWTNNSYGVFPFCRFGEGTNFFLTWWKTQNTTGLLPIYLSIKEFNAVGPVWWNKDSLGLFPLLSYHSSAREKKVGILFHLIGGYKERFPYSAQTNGQNQIPRHNYSYTFDWLCYLGKAEVSMYPHRGLSHHFRMWPLFDYSSTSQIYPANNAEGTFRHNAIFGALWNYRCYSHYNWSGDKAKECRELFTLIKNAQIAIAQKQSTDNSQQNTNLFDTLSSELINGKCQLLGLEPPDKITHDSLNALANKLALKYPQNIVKARRFGMLLDIIDYNNSNSDNTSFKLFWGALFRHSSSPDKSENTVLWRAFRQVRTPTTTSREIFPFISYYHNKNDNTTGYSFAWRLFRRETSPDGNKLWLFFIPFQ